MEYWAFCFLINVIKEFRKLFAIIRANDSPLNKNNRIHKTTNLLCISLFTFNELSALKNNFFPIDASGFSRNSPLMMSIFKNCTPWNSINNTSLEFSIVFFPWNCIKTFTTPQTLLSILSSFSLEFHQNSYHPLEIFLGPSTPLNFQNSHSHGIPLASTGGRGTDFFWKSSMVY